MDWLIHLSYPQVSLLNYIELSLFYDQKLFLEENYRFLFFLNGRQTQPDFFYLVISAYFFLEFHYLTLLHLSLITKNILKTWNSATSFSGNLWRMSRIWLNSPPNVQKFSKNAAELINQKSLFVEPRHWSILETHGDSGVFVELRVATPGPLQPSEDSSAEQLSGPHRGRARNAFRGPGTKLYGGRRSRSAPASRRRCPKSLFR